MVTRCARGICEAVCGTGIAATSLGLFVAEALTWQAVYYFLLCVCADLQNNVPEEWGVKRIQSAIRDAKQYTANQRRSLALQREREERDRELEELRQPPVELRDDSDDDEDGDGFKTPTLPTRRRLEMLKKVLEDEPGAFLLATLI